MTYDTSGHQMAITSASRSFTYDAENRQIQATIAGTVTAYAYDSDGRRVEKSVSGASPTVYVYDAQGQLAAEYGGQVPSTAGTVYLTADHLGSTRLVSNAASCSTRRGALRLRPIRRGMSPGHRRQNRALLAEFLSECDTSTPGFRQVANVD